MIISELMLRRSSSRGDYHRDPSAHFSFTSGTSPACTTRTSTGTTIAICPKQPSDADSAVEVDVVVDLSDTPEIVVFSSDFEPVKGLKDHLEEEDDLEEDQEVDEVMEEQQIDQEIDEIGGSSRWVRRSIRQSESSRRIRLMSPTHITIHLGIVRLFQVFT